MGAIALASLLGDAPTALDLSNPESWIPPSPQGEEWQALAASPREGEAAGAAVSAAAAEQAPPVPPVPIPDVHVQTENAFPKDPFDANGCPILAPSDVRALATLPYREFRAVAGNEAELPPLPEGYDVMPLAQSTGIFVETEDVFRFRAISTNNSVAVSFFGRVQRPSGYIIPFNHTLQTSTANTTFTTTPVPGKGILLGCAASVPIGSITAGSVYAVGEIGRAQGGTFIPHTLLFSGQLDDLTPLTVDGGGLPPAAQRPTFQNTSSAGATAPPKNVVVTPSAGKRMRFTKVQFTVTTNASVGQRSPSVNFVYGGTGLFTSLAGLTIGESTTATAYGSIGAGNSMTCPASVSGGIPVPISLPESLYFYEAVTVQAGLEGSFVGDTVSSMFIRWEET